MSLIALPTGHKTKKCAKNVLMYVYAITEEIQLGTCTSLKWLIFNHIWIWQGVIVTGITYWLQVWVIEKKGSVFTAMFTPLALIITAIFSAIMWKEAIYWGRSILHTFIHHLSYFCYSYDIYPNFFFNIFFKTFGIQFSITDTKNQSYTAYMWYIIVRFR